MIRIRKIARSKGRRKKLCSEECETLQATSLRQLGVPMQHAPRFLKIVNDAKSRVKETTVDEVKQQLDNGDKVLLVDVREESEFAKDHLPGAIHLGKGVIERDIEGRVPDVKTSMILYCGGGFRSAMAADNLQKMGYTNVISMDGGVREWREKKYSMARDRCGGWGGAAPPPKKFFSAPRGSFFSSFSGRALPFCRISSPTPTNTHPCSPTTSI